MVIELIVTQILAVSNNKCWLNSLSRRFCPFPLTNVDWSWRHALRSCHFQWQGLIEVGVMLSDPAVFSDKGWLKLASYSQILPLSVTCVDWSLHHTLRFCLFSVTSVDWSWHHTLRVSLFSVTSVDWSQHHILRSCLFSVTSVDWNWCHTLRFSVCLFSVMKVDWSWGRTLRYCPLAVSNAQSGAHSCCEIWYEQNLAQSSIKCTC